MTDERLAVVVDRHRTQRVIDALQAAGIDDPDRSVRAYGEGRVAVPVTAVPDAVDYDEVVSQVGEPRVRTLADHLAERGWREDEIEAAPSSWAVVGSVVLVEVGDAPRPAEVGEALLDLHGEADTVLARGGIAGQHREPDVTVLAGEGDTETVHREHGTAYALDLAEVMFSPGNKAERARMGAVVRGDERRESPERASGDDGPASHDERVLDAFAGIGYFTLPMAGAGARVTAVERNPAAFEYLLENAMRNGVTDRVSAYRGDNREVVPELDGDFDRAVLGHYDAWESLDAVLPAVAADGVVHLHEATPAAVAPDRPVERLREAAAALDRGVDVLDTRVVKTYSEGVDHVVVDARVGEPGSA